MRIMILLVSYVSMIFGEISRRYFTPSAMKLFEFAVLVVSRYVFTYIIFTYGFMEDFAGFFIVQKIDALERRIFSGGLLEEKTC